MPLTKTLSRRRLIYVVMLAASLLYLFATIGYPIVAIPQAAHDDALFYRGLKALERGDWLGAYDNRTLVKGPFVSIFGAVANLFGSAEKSAEAVLYLVVSLLAAVSLRRIGASRITACVSFVLLLSCPYIWSEPGRRFLRDGLYGSLVLATLLLTLCAIIERRRPRAGLLATASGLTTGCAYMTREEDIWLVAILLTLVVGAAIRTMVRFGPRRLLDAAVHKMIVVVCFVAGLVGSVGPVLLMNKAEYGRAIVSETRAPEFVAAVGSLMRVGRPHPSGFVPVTNAAMQTVLQTVPEAAPLKKSWPEIAAGWSLHGRSLIPDDPEQIAGGWFIWAFRDAVAASGHFGTPEDARAFMVRFADGVNSACDDGRLSCRARRETLRPELTPALLPKLITRSWHALLHTVSVKAADPALLFSDPAAAGLEDWSRRIGPVVVSLEEDINASGWIAAPGHAGAFELSAQGDFTAIVREASYAPAPDVVAYFKGLGQPDMAATRFSLSLKCPELTCTLSLVDGSRGETTVDFRAIDRGEMGLPAPFRGYLDQILNKQSPDLQPPSGSDLRVAVAQVASRVAQVVVPSICVLGTLGLLVWLVALRRSREQDWLAILAVAALVAVLGRSAIIGYISVTSWNAVNTGYLGPAYPFAILYGCLGTAILVARLRALRCCPRLSGRPARS
ncbi:hypothetical protein [Donghicola tyrosinivorans]|uniref:Dolichyl-phosphate-mannose-protein mannosyltransferase n=1 Tax=Donghicola tyrosinivorans TaxID=1652492 RepID=A0A2T0WWC1_9RHOB|nr:hypothetical protein [Donghicola tyrosinivorans]PRY90992.1 hypothetical protein CLV74_1044 [Donghicola tyrosinivorans]